VKVATSELSKLPITKAQPSISLASSTPVLPAASTTSNVINSLEATATSFKSINVVYTGASQPAQSSSIGTTSTNVSSSTSVGLSRLSVIMIIAFAVVGLVLIIFMVLLRRHLRSIFCQIRSSFNNQGNRNDAQLEVSQPTAVYHQTRPIVNDDNETGSAISQVNEVRLSTDGWAVSTSSDCPERVRTIFLPAHYIRKLTLSRKYGLKESTSFQIVTIAGSPPLQKSILARIITGYIPGW